MSTQVKRRRGSTSEIDNFTPAVGEIVVDTTTNELVLGDGVKLGGYRMARKDRTELFFNQLDDALSNNSLTDGDSVVIKERTAGNGGGGNWDVVLTSSVTPNTFGIVQHVTIPTLSLVLRLQSSISDKAFGAVYDGVTDDGPAIQAAYNAISNTESWLIHGPGTALIDPVNSTVNIPSNVKAGWLPDTIWQAATNDQDSYEVLDIGNQQNIYLYRPKIIGDRDTHTGVTGEQGHCMQISGTTTENIYIYDPICNDAWGDGVALRNGKNVFVYNLIADNNRRQGLTINQGENINFYSPRCTNSNGISPEAGIDIEPNDGQYRMSGINLINPYTEGNAGAGINVSLRSVDLGNNQDVSIIIDNHVDKGSTGGCQCTMRAADVGAQLRGSVHINNPRYNENSQYGFIALDWRIFTAGSPMIYLNNPVVTNSNSSGNSATFGSAISCQRHSGSSFTENIGNLVVTHPTVRDTRNTPLVAKAIYAVDATGGGASAENLSIIDPIAIEGPVDNDDYIDMNINGAVVSDVNNTSGLLLTSGVTIQTPHNLIENGTGAFYTVTDSVDRLVDFPMTLQSTSGSGIRFTPKAGEAVLPLSTVDGKYIETTEKGALITLRRRSDGSGADWYIEKQIGTWTVEP